MKKRDKQMEIWFEEKKVQLSLLTDKTDILKFYNKTLLPEMDKLDKLEERSWKNHRADYQKKLIFLIDLHTINGATIAKTEKVGIRNITFVHSRAIDSIRTKLLPLILLKFKLERIHEWQEFMRDKFIYTTKLEREFCAEIGEKYVKHWK